MAERVGVEPTEPIAELGDLANRCLRPLGHLSKIGAQSGKSGAIVANPALPGQAKNGAPPFGLLRSLFTGVQRPGRTTNY